NLSDSGVRCSKGELVGKRRAAPNDLVLRNSMPDRQDHLGPARHFAGHKSIELVLSPILREERWGDHHYPEPAVREAMVDFSAEAVADPQLELVEPDIETLVLERVS